MLLNLDYLQLQRESANPQKMQAIFCVLGTKKSNPKEKKILNVKSKL
jgi:hypothetical protein